MPEKAEDVQRNRSNLRRLVHEQDHVFKRDGTNRLPIVAIEDFFTAGITRHAVPSRAILTFGIEAFRDRLMDVRGRDDVADVAIQIWGFGEEEDWPTLGYIFIATSQPRSTVTTWLEGIQPDAILRAGGVDKPFVRAQIIRAEAIRTRPGYEVHALFYERDSEEDV